MEDAKLVAFLKYLATLGALSGFAPVSSRELGEGMGFSQQSAANWILRLVKEGYIERQLGAKKQHIKLTEKGAAALRKEYTDYQRIFETPGTLTLTGAVTTGFGEGGYYINQEGYMKQFRDKLGFKPYEGTLNLRLSSKELGTLEMLKNSQGIEIAGFKQGKRTFGAVKCFLATIENLECAVVMPKRSHYKAVIEVISKVHMRRTLSLSDGDEVKLNILL
ncbi:MAG: DUF120 domain-containing protein [Thermoplasmata archaeon]|nr:MAG: DUF120 domain-containing protein [Thermoplasmata archaeon]